MRREGNKEDRMGVQAGRRQIVTTGKGKGRGKGPAPTSDPLLPHERDQTADPHGEDTGSRELIEQAGRDIKRGLRDTERRGTLNDVPGTGVDPQSTPGADVPDKDREEEGKAGRAGRAGGRAGNARRSRKPRSP